MVDIKLQIVVVPNSQITAVKSVDNDEIRIAINQPPENNKANVELCRYLSKVFKIKKTDIKIIGGFTNKHKTLIINMENKIDIINILKNEI
ncbi:hypothetical protein AAJ76_2000150977 [Vairimorpha ceranae]|uniref:Uncharacterized protein n=1 Tax=Vairimorpha ceranae TaxID=40302 RepID=A0A0F9WH09_9MICR|nr:hypothetical protein AAJ76_2000150977 [Vairimorpha ceranae]KAF5141348.1 hypothetical protein G9O61_00g006650 [Vairimorpha ceranae]KKO76591.1 hypothetical protein AAJ76_2000150977 [Vairimorpha ceranae]